MNVLLDLWGLIDNGETDILHAERH
jgi:hypothetical protein